MGSVRLPALFDTGSTVTLVHARYMPAILRSCSSDRPVRTTASPTLASANGTTLHVEGTFLIPIAIGKDYFSHDVCFVRDLQVPCIIGMDFMSRHSIQLDTATKRICIPPTNRQVPANPVGQDVRAHRAINLPAYSETKISVPTPRLTCALVENHSKHDPDVEVMEGVINSVLIDDKHYSSIILANTSSQDKSIARGDVICAVTNNVSCKPLPLSVKPIPNQRPVLQRTDHVDKISLEHIPVQYRTKYRTLLRSYVDVFSRHDLDVGRCSTLPHVVRLNDPNKVVAINQYRLPYHLKEVAIDYVDKLLKSGVVRESTSVFNTPLMLVKKPHADPNKPLAEQYRLVHNYVELNKNPLLLSLKKPVRVTR